MFTLDSPFGDAANHPLIRPYAEDFVRGRNLSGLYRLPIRRLESVFRPEGILNGLNALLSAAEKGNCFHQIYSRQEIEEDPSRETAHLMFFPSDDPKASERPYFLICPGGAYCQVWSIVEGFPIASKLNSLGYHAFVLVYRVHCSGVLPYALEDVSRTLTYIRENNRLFPLQWDRYDMAGFSAGAHLICTWSMKNHGYAAFGQPAPGCLFPAYVPVSWRLEKLYGHVPEFPDNALGMKVEEAAESDWNIDEHAEGFPPCYLVCASDDNTVDSRHSRLLKSVLDEAGIPCILEEKPTGGHGFGDGTGTDAAGWLDRAAAFAEKMTR